MIEATRPIFEYKGEKVTWDDKRERGDLAIDWWTVRCTNSDVVDDDRDLERASTEPSDPGDDTDPTTETALPRARGSYRRMRTELGTMPPKRRRAELFWAVESSDGVPDAIDDDLVTDRIVDLN